MSDDLNQSYQPQSQDHASNLQSNNPFNGSGTSGSLLDDQSGSQGQQQHYQQQQEGFAAPPGPPPGHQPTRAGTFKESDFVPENERGEQREAMEQFEMNKSGNESQLDQEVAQLQQEYPGIDGSLVAAIHSDNGNLGASREMLQELASQTQGSSYGQTL